MQPTRKPPGSTVIPWPGTSTSPSYEFNRALVPIGPGALSNVFDVLVELQPSNRERYANPERTSYITIYAMPISVALTLERLRERVTSTSKPGLEVSLACCAANGIVALEKDANLQELSLQRRRIFQIENPDAAFLEEARNWCDKCDIRLPESDKAKLNVYMPDWLKMSVHGLAKQIGVAGWPLLILAVMTTLVTQRKTLDEHREIMRKSLNKFHRRMELRREIGKALIQFIDTDPPERDEKSEEESES